jgi:hypothetical protein
MDSWCPGCDFESRTGTLNLAKKISKNEVGVPHFAFPIETTREYL